jgi:hypothetical protein
MNPKNNIPNFLIAGFQKSGSTYLDSLLREHKDIFLAQRTTNHSFFDDNEIYKNGTDWYLKLFSDANANSLLGHTSVDCSFNQNAIQRILKLNPEMKLIFIMRHPISRSYSHYWHQIKMSREHLSFRKAIEQENKITSKNYYNNKNFSYVGRSKYKNQFDNLFKFISKDKVLIIPFESFIKDELTFLNKIFDFLSVDKINSKVELLKTNSIKTNPSRLPPKFIQKTSYLFRWNKITRFIFTLFLIQKRPPKIKEEDRKYLEQVLKEDIIFYNSIKSNFE